MIPGAEIFFVQKWENLAKKWHFLEKILTNPRDFHKSGVKFYEFF
jgi:hypothetical protein